MFRPCWNHALSTLKSCIVYFVRRGRSSTKMLDQGNSPSKGKSGGIGYESGLKKRDQWRQPDSWVQFSWVQLSPVETSKPGWLLINGLSRLSSWEFMRAWIAWWWEFSSIEGFGYELRFGCSDERREFFMSSNRIRQSWLNWSILNNDKIKVETKPIGDSKSGRGGEYMHVLFSRDS